MVLEVRGGGVIPLPYLIEKQRYNLTDEIIERLRHYKDFDDLKKAIEKEDANNDLVIEILDQNVSMIDDDSKKTAKVKLQAREPRENPKDVLQPKKKSLHEDTDEDQKSSLPTPYIVKGDGQITIKIVSPEKRDKFLAGHHTLRSGKAVMSAETEDAAQTAEHSDKAVDQDKGTNQDKEKSSGEDKKSIFLSR